MAEPRTEAGKALWFDMTARSGGEALEPAWIEHLRSRIVDIEYEAFRPAYEEGPAPAEGLDACVSCGMPVLELVPLIEHAAGCAVVRPIDEVLREAVNEGIRRAAGPRSPSDEKTRREAARSMLADMRGEYEG